MVAGNCDECDEHCTDGILVEDKDFAGQFYCQRCWDRWLSLPFHFHFTVADAHSLSLKAVAGAEVLMQEPSAESKPVRAKVVNPYHQPGRLEVSTDSACYIVQHRHLRPYKWASQHQLARPEVWSQDPLLVGERTALRDRFTRLLQASSEGAPQVCEFGNSPHGDAVHFAEMLAAHVTSLESKEDADEVLDWPQCGQISVVCPFEVVSLCDLVATELQGWRQRFHGIWAKETLASFKPTELAEIASKLHFCLRPNGLIALMLGLRSAGIESGNTTFARGVQDAEDELKEMLLSAGWRLEACQSQGAWMSIVARSPADLPRVSPLLEAVLCCHKRWTNEPGRPAHGASFDHSSQPDRFLRFPGTRMIDLPTEMSDDGADWLSQLLYDALSLTRWQSLGDDREVYAFRRNPSSGGLQPLEFYVLTAGGFAVQGLGAAPVLAHYHAFWHALQVLCNVPPQLWRRIEAQLPAGSVLVAMTTFYYRTAWKYGEVSFPAIQRDTGHAIGCLTQAALALGRQCLLLDSVGHDDLAGLLGLSDGNLWSQQPQALLAITPDVKFSPCSFALPHMLLPLTWRNDPTVEGPLPQLLADAHLATWKPRHDCTHADCSGLWCEPLASQQPLPWTGAELRRLLARRRSYIEFDGSTSLTLKDFYSILRSIMPASSMLGAFGAARSLLPLVLVFVQRVHGLPVGLYALVRDVARLDCIRRCAPSGPHRYCWTPVVDAPDDIPLFLLDQADVSDCADACTLGQGRMHGGAVVLVIFAEYEPALRAHGSWLYRRLLWESGAIGQALYIAAEGVGMNGTGHGAYFGTFSHEVLGVDVHELQDTYHFVIGAGITDQRMQLAPYDHLEYYRTLPNRDVVNTTFACAVGEVPVLRVRGRH